MSCVIVTKEALELSDQYDRDPDYFDRAGRWAKEKERLKVTSEQIALLGEYIEKLYFSKAPAFSPPPGMIGFSVQMKENAVQRIAELERVIDPAVIEILRKRVQ